jgi:uncharacterized membrane protein YdjX (TVP38/TMEM64 family)
MDGWIAYVVTFGAIFGTNLMPAFGPPTWTLLVFFKFNTDLPLATLVIGGALASASGRFLLASAARRFRHRFSEERIARLEREREVLERDRRYAIGGLAVFLLSPLPSAQLFVAAGLLGTKLVQLTIAFFLGRLVSYTVYLGGATIAEESLGDAIVDSITSPAGIAAQLVLVAAIVALVELDWTKWLPGAGRTPHDDDGRP